MSEDAKTKETTADSKTGFLAWTWKDAFAFLGTLIRIILPKHTVILIILGIMGYFLFFPTVRDIETYKNLMSVSQWTPFMGVYFCFGIVYLVGWMWLTYKINAVDQKHEFDLRIAEIQERSGSMHTRLVAIESAAMEYLKNELHVPLDKMRLEVKIGRENHKADVAIYGETFDKPIAIVEWVTNPKATKSWLERLMKYMRSISDVEIAGGYFLVANASWFEPIRFYDFTGKEAKNVPNYEELLEMMERG